MVQTQGVAHKTAKIRQATYRYSATDAQGKLVHGSIRAFAEIEAERLLIRRGLNPLSLEAVPSAFSLEEALPTLFRVKQREVIIFSRQLATLLKSGISLLPALKILRDLESNGRAFRKVLHKIFDDIGAGGSFSDALSKHRKVFSEIYYRTIGVGEQTGNLDVVLTQMADYLERQGATTQKIRKAMAYPSILIAVGIVVVIILMTVVMPRLMLLFRSMNLDLPLPTRILVGTYDFVSQNKLVLAAVAVALSALIFLMGRYPRGRKILNQLIISAPIIGPPLLLTEFARFAQSMSLLVTAGLSLQAIMELMPQTTSNYVIRDSVRRLRDSLLLGEGLSEPMSHDKLFPPLLVQMVAVGEESNTLGYTMGVVAGFYQTSADEKIDSLVSMLPTVATIVMAVGVGFIALAVLMPMYSFTGALGR